MIAVTERARQELKRILLDKVDNAQAGLRLTAGDSGQLGLAIDIEMPGDQVVERDDSKVLLVENGLALSLEGIAIDIEDTPEGPRLVIVKQS
jgi:Fe-S cluster assembly iron-binding protein IscA